MSLNKNSIYIYFLLFSCFGIQAQSTEKKDSILTENLDEVVVTATRTVRQLSSLPLPVTLISKKQIAQTGVTRLNEILNEQTGIVMTADATVGGGEGVQIQGVASDYVLILIDGVPVIGRSSGNLDLSRLAIGNIKQIEVVKGPSSSLFGSEALGGVINIITEKPTSSTLRGKLSHRYATFNNHNTSVSINQRKKQIGYSLFVDRLSTNGYVLAPGNVGQTVNPFENYTLNGRAFLEVSDRFNLFASGRFFTQEFDVTPSISEEQDLNLLLRADHDPSKNTNLQYELYLTNYRTNEEILDPINNESLISNDFNQQLFRPEIRYNQKINANHTLTFGGGLNLEQLQRNLFANEVFFASQYLFSQFDAHWGSKLNLIVGARFDHHNVYNAQLSPKLSVRYQLTENLALKGSVGSGFKAPDFRQLYLDFTNAAGGGYAVFGKEVERQGIERLQENGEIANLAIATTALGAPLDAESSVGYNLGASFKRGKFSSEINLFRNDFTNLIDTRILGTKNNGQNIFGYVNRESVFTQGIEADLTFRPTKQWRLSAGYQLLYAYDKNKREQAANGQLFARDPQTQQSVRLSRSDYFGLENRSRHTLNLKAFYEIPQWKANANLRVVYRSRFGLTDRNGNDLLDTFDNSFINGFALVNLSLGKTFLERYQLQLGANNLLDLKGNNPLASQGDEVLINPGIQLFTRINIQF